MQHLHQQPQKRGPGFQKISRKQKSTSVFPILIASILIVAVFGGFYLKRLNKEKQLLTQKLAESEKITKDKELQVPLISPQETSKIIRDKDYQLVDIRESDEFTIKHIEASINIPLSKLEEEINLLSKTKTIIIIDRKDSAKGKVLTEHLQSEGLTVKYLDGGIINYAHNGYSLVTIGNPLIQSDALKVTSYTAKELIDQLMNGARLKFVDTRPEVEFALDHLNGSINIPLEELEKKKDLLPIRTFVVFDKDPIRSFQAAVRLYDMNVIGVYNCKDTYADLKQVIENLGNENKEEETTN